jgi:Dolichyl-phosphate-mannose-protein mannosyltransferase
VNPVGLATRARRHWLFGLVLVAALALRILVALAFRPIMWFGGDSASYLATGLRLIPDPARVGGYGFMLWILRPLHSFALVAAVQHLMGLAMGVLIYLLARRFGLPAWAATLATLPVLFDAYELQLESDALPDVPFAFLVVLALYLLLRSPGERRPARTTAAAFLLGVSALLWPVGLVLLGVLLVVLLTALLIRRAGLVTVLAALLAGALPVAAYSAWFSIHRHQFSLTRSDGVYLWSRTMSFADCAVIRPPAAERPLCPPPGPRIAASLYIWNANSPVLAMPTGRFSPRTNHLALHFALRAIAAQPGDYAAAAAHDFSLSFFWDRPVHPDAAIVDRYQFADATTAWVPPTLWTPGGGTLAADQAAYNNGRPAPTRAVQPYASWLVTYQRYVYLRGALLGVILLAGLAGMVIRRRVNGLQGPGLPWAFAVTILLVPPLVADFDLRYLVPAVPVACLAAALAFAPAAGPEMVQRRWTTSPAATATSEPEDTRTSSLPSESTPATGPESA